jgi:hypothetical protein
MPLPSWLQPIENVFRAAEQWTTTKRFLAMFAGAAVLMVALGAVILHRRHDAGWLKDTKEFDTSGVTRKYCGKEIRWDRGMLPIPVWLDPALDKSWEQPLKDGLALADPWGKLFAWKGWMPPGTDPMRGSVTVMMTNDDKHGHEIWQVTDAGTYCQMVQSTIEMPVLMLPGKARTRASAHELLHAMGLSHSDWETHLMYPVATTLFPFSMSATEKALLEGAYIK